MYSAPTIWNRLSEPMRRTPRPLLSGPGGIVSAQSVPPDPGYLESAYDVWLGSARGDEPPRSRCEGFSIDRLVFRDSKLAPSAFVGR